MSLEVCTDPLKILGFQDLVIEEVEVPEWGCSLLVRRLAGVERDRFESSLLGEKTVTFENSTARLCAMSICDRDGKRLFTESQIVDLGAKSSAALSRIYNVARRLSRIGAQSLEDAEKNSEATPGGSSSSGLPQNGVAPSASA